MKESRVSSFIDNLSEGFDEYVAFLQKQLVITDDFVPSAVATDQTVSAVPTVNWSLLRYSDAYKKNKFSEDKSLLKFSELDSVLDEYMATLRAFDTFGPNFFKSLEEA